MEYEIGIRLEQLLANQEVLNEKIDKLLKAANVEEPERKKGRPPKEEPKEDDL